MTQASIILLTLLSIWIVFALFCSWLGIFKEDREILKEHNKKWNH